MDNLTNLCMLAYRVSLSGDPSPLFAADEAGHQQSEVEITLHFRGVEKRFAIPGQHLQELLDVYGLLQHLVLPGAIRCKSLEVNKIYVICLSLCFHGAVAHFVVLRAYEPCMTMTKLHLVIAFCYA
ncbi:TPA: hypothetical protein ACH3X1_004261 [Trebouxia sp. C0004]